MKRLSLLVAMTAIVAFGAATANAVDPIFYFDVNDTGTESGITDSGLYPWDATVTTLNWNPAADGSGTAVNWVNGKDAVFSAGTDASAATSLGYGLNIAAGTTAASALLEEGKLSVVTGMIDTGAGIFTVGNGIGTSAVFEVGNGPTTKTNSAGTLRLHGGTYRLVTVQTVGHSFLSATKNLEINQEGTIDHFEGGAVGAGRVAIYGGTSGTILGTGGTTANGGAGTLIVNSIHANGGEVRYQGAGMPNSTYAKLKVTNYALFRLGNSASIADERGFGAVPLAPLADAIVLDGGTIGTSFGVTLHANRGIRLDAGGGWFNNSGGTMSVPSIVSGSGSLNKNIDANLIKGTATASGTLNLTSATGNTYSGGTNVNAGNLKVINTSGSGTGTGPVNVGGTTTTQFGTFLGHGSVSGLTTVNDFGEIRPGGTTTATLDNAGTLTLNGGLTMNGTSVASRSLLTFQLGTTGNDLLVVGGVNGLNFAGNTKLNVLANGTFGAGTYPLIDYDTSFLGTLGTNFFVGTVGTDVPTGFNYSLVNNTTNTTIDLVASLACAAGDANCNGSFNAEDYVLIRKVHGDVTTGTGLTQYTAWRAAFTGIPGSGSGLGAGAVPEPTSIGLVLIGLAALACGRRGRVA